MFLNVYKIYIVLLHSQTVPDASSMRRSASTVTPQRPQEVNLRDYTLEKPSQDRPHHRHHHHHCHHRRDRDRERDREKRQRSLDTPLGGQPPTSAGQSNLTDTQSFIFYCLSLTGGRWLLPIPVL